MTHNKNIFLLLSIIIPTACASNIYHEELQAFKKNAQKDIFHNDLNPRLQSLRDLNRYFENYKQLDFAQSWSVPSIMLNLGIVVTQDTMPQLYAYVKNICAREAIDMPVIFICTSPGLFNAFAAKLFTNIGGILIGQEFFDLTQEEVEAIVAHELGHIKYNHINKKLALVWLFYVLLTCSTKYTPTCVHTFPANIFLVILYTQLVINKSFEKEADLFACQQGKAEGIKTFFTRCADEELQEAIAFNQTLDEIKASKELVPSSVYYFNMMPLYYMSKIERYLHNGIKWIYNNTPWGDHPSYEARIKAAQEYIDAHAS